MLETENNAAMYIHALTIHLSYKYLQKYIQYIMITEFSLPCQLDQKTQTNVVGISPQIHNQPWKKIHM